MFQILHIIPTILNHNIRSKARPIYATTGHWIDFERKRQQTNKQASMINKNPNIFIARIFITVIIVKILLLTFCYLERESFIYISELDIMKLACLKVCCLWRGLSVTRDGILGFVHSFKLSFKFMCSISMSSLLATSAGKYIFLLYSLCSPEGKIFSFHTCISTKHTRG